MKYFLFAAALLLNSSVFADNYDIDGAHTGVEFDVAHLGFSSVTGRFDKFEGTFTLDPKTHALIAAKGVIQAKSINTNNEKRDKHLRSEDFFAASKFPTLSFESESVDIKPGRSGKMKGNLTMRGVTLPVTFKVEFNGAGKDPWGNEKAAFVAKTEVNRKDFGLKWNEVLETGGLLVGEKVGITIRAEGNKVAQPAVADTGNKKVEKKEKK